MPSLNKNDEVRTFLKENNYSLQYNDGLLAWLRNYFLVDTFTLNDLLIEYTNLNGYTMFIPGQLFDASEEGFWYDFGDISTLYQDNAATTPVTAFGQSVGYVGDKSGNGYHVTQSNASLRPVYTTDPNGVPCLQFDGTKYLSSATVDWTGETKATFSSGQLTTSNASAGIVYGHNAAFISAGGVELLSPTGANTTNLMGGRSTSGATSYMGLVLNNAAPYKFVVTSYIDYDQSAGNEAVGIWNGEAMTQNGGNTQENTGTFGNGVISVGARPGSFSFPYTGYIYSIIARCGVSTDQERNHINTYINDKTKSY